MLQSLELLELAMKDLTSTFAAFADLEAVDDALCRQVTDCNRARDQC